MKVTKWNSIKHLDSEESRKAYMDEMMIDSNPKVIAKAEETVNRSKTYHNKSSSLATKAQGELLASIGK